MLAELLRAAAADGQPKKASIPAMADEMLREAAQRYGAARKACPFVPGDLITPRKDSIYSGAGNPHIVVEVAERAEPNFTGREPTSPTFGCILDVRVLAFSGGDIAPYWVESWQFEPWEPAKPVADGQPEQP